MSDKILNQSEEITIVIPIITINIKLEKLNSYISPSEKITPILNIKNTEKGIQVNIDIPEEKVITNLEPSEDIIVPSGESFTVSFNAPPEGEGYVKFLYPMAMGTMSEGNYGSPMIEVEPGYYEGKYTIPIKIADVIIEVTYLDPYGNKTVERAKGRVTLI